MTPYYHVPYPFKAQLDSGTPVLGPQVAWQLVKILESLAKMGHPKPVELDTALNTYAAKVQAENGCNVYTYVHPVIDVPTTIDISEDVQPVLRLPERVAHDIATNWPSMVYVPQRQAKTAAPVYRLLIFPMRHRCLGEMEQENDVHTLGFLDRQTDQLTIYDFESRGSPGRVLDLARFWHHVEVSIVGRRNFVMPPGINLAEKLRGVVLLDALQIANESQHPQSGVDTMWSLLASAVHLINHSQASDPLPRIDNDIDTMTGMRVGLLPRLFVELLTTLKSQTTKDVGDGSLTRALRNTWWLRQHFKISPWRLNALTRPLLQRAEDARELPRGTTNALCDECHVVLDQDPGADEPVASEEEDDG